MPSPGSPTLARIEAQGAPTLPWNWHQEPAGPVLMSWQIQA